MELAAMTGSNHNDLLGVIIYNVANSPINRRECAARLPDSALSYIPDGRITPEPHYGVMMRFLNRAVRAVRACVRPSIDREEHL